jgi:hypothetical protein
MFFELFLDGLILMRASARTRVTFVPAKVTKTIRSGTPPCGSPAFLDKAAQKELGIFDPSNTALLYPALSAVLSGVQSQWVYFSVKL